jgi:hypothetical protein
MYEDIDLDFGVLAGFPHPVFRTRHVSGIICIRYAQNRKIGQTNILVLGAIKPKGINRLSKID